MKRAMSKKAKLSILRTVFIPILTYGHESWIIIESVQLQVQAFEMRFLRRIEGVTLFNKVRFENFLTSRRYFSEMKDLSLDNLAM